MCVCVCLLLVTSLWVGFFQIQSIHLLFVVEGSAYVPDPKTTLQWVIFTYMQKKEKTGHRLIDNEFVLDQLGRTELNADLLCEAGWCLELEQLPFMGDSTLRVDDWYFMESDLLIDEL